MTILEELPARIDDLTLQISQLREEMRGEFAAVRGEMDSGFAAVRAEMHAGDEEARRALREEIRAGDEETRRVLRDQIRAGDAEIMGHPLDHGIRLRMDGRPVEWVGRASDA